MTALYEVEGSVSLAPIPYTENGHQKLHTDLQRIASTHPVYYLTVDIWPVACSSTIYIHLLCLQRTTTVSWLSAGSADLRIVRKSDHSLDSRARVTNIWHLSYQRVLDMSGNVCEHEMHVTLVEKESDDAMGYSHALNASGTVTSAVLKELLRRLPEEEKDLSQLRIIGRPMVI